MSNANRRNGLSCGATTPIGRSDPHRALGRDVARDLRPSRSTDRRARVPPSAPVRGARRIVFHPSTRRRIVFHPSIHRLIVPHARQTATRTDLGTDTSSTTVRRLPPRHRPRRAPADRRGGRSTRSHAPGAQCRFADRWSRVERVVRTGSPDDHPDERQDFCGCSSSGSFASFGRSSRSSSGRYRVWPASTPDFSLRAGLSPLETKGVAADGSHYARGRHIRRRGRC